MKVLFVVNESSFLLFSMKLTKYFLKFKIWVLKQFTFFVSENNNHLQYQLNNISQQTFFMFDKTTAAKIYRTKAKNNR